MAIGTRCDCARHPDLDPRGHHIITGCAKGPARISTHDSLKEEVDYFLRFNGLRTRMEETQVFQMGPETNKRPDISILEGTLFQKKTILDVSITCPVREAIPGIRPKGAAADLMYSTKVRKYSGLAQANRLDFKPIIFESTGHVHEEAVRFFLKVAEHAEQYRKIAQNTLFNYFMALLSCNLQKSLASALLENHLRINGNYSRAPAILANYNHIQIAEYDAINA